MKIKKIKFETLLENAKVDAKPHFHDVESLLYCYIIMEFSNK